MPAEFKAGGTSVYLSLQNQAPGGKLEMRVDSALIVWQLEGRRSKH